MKKLLQKPLPLVAAVASTMLLLPFALLELINKPSTHPGFPVSLYTFAWIVQFVFFAALIPVIKTLQSKKSISKKPLLFLIQIAVLATAAAIWTGWLIDQWPCMMGVPNCD
jgi:cytochrome bd-type quinol oxidase subunit 1